MSPDTLVQHFDAVADAPNGVQKLRDLILQLAVRGKLVPQDPSDEPASILLERMEVERQQRFPADKTAKPLQRISEDKVPFLLPAAWRWVRLGTVTNARTGKLDANAQDLDGEFPFFTCARDPLQINIAAYDCECVLLAGNGEFHVNYYSGPFNAYQRTYIIESRSKSVLEVPYLYRFMMLYSAVLRKESIGGVIQYIKIGHLTNALFPLPPLPEQRRIVEKVDQLMALCDELEERQRRRTETQLRLNRASLHHLTATTDDAELTEHWQRIRNNFHLLYDAPGRWRSCGKLSCSWRSGASW